MYDLWNLCFNRCYLKKRMNFVESNIIDIQDELKTIPIWRFAHEDSVEKQFKELNEEVASNKASFEAAQPPVATEFDKIKDNIKKIEALRELRPFNQNSLRRN